MGDIADSDAVYVEQDQIWTDTPGMFLRVLRSDSGKYRLEIRTGPQGSTSKSSVVVSFDLASYRVTRLAGLLITEEQEG